MSRECVSFRLVPGKWSPDTGRHEDAEILARRIGVACVCRRKLQTWKSTVMDLSISDFRAVITRHNGHNFSGWRREFATHASSLAAFFKTFPGTERFALNTIRDLFT